MTISPTLYASRSEEWGTPQAFFDALNAEFHFTLDAAASIENHKCTRFLSKDGTNAFAVHWPLENIGVGVANWNADIRFHHAIFCNPPYGRTIGAWFAKAREAAKDGATIVMLAHARTDTIWWHAHVQGIADEVRFVKGRLKFVGPSGVKSSAPFPSAVIIYRPKKG